jgi:phage recombination protein Bet
LAEQTDRRREARQIQRQAAERFVSGDADARLPALVPERIAYHPVVQEKFGIDRAAWRALIDAIWPGATSAEGVLLALSYCRGRNLDPFKRPVHIVPVWSNALRRMVEGVWPGIGELRTTAHRTGQYAGMDKPEWGPEITSRFLNKEGKTIEITHPQWCEVTVYRLVGGQPRPFPGPRVYWMETYATESRDSDWPNSMWRKRVWGQIGKCAEAAALRAAFPEEVGQDYIEDEIGPQMTDLAPAAIAEPPQERTPRAQGWGPQFTAATPARNGEADDETPPARSGEPDRARPGAGKKAARAAAPEPPDDHVEQEATSAQPDPTAAPGPYDDDGEPEPGLEPEDAEPVFPVAAWETSEPIDRDLPWHEAIARIRSLCEEAPGKPERARVLSNNFRVLDAIEAMGEEEAAAVAELRKGR